MPLIRRASMGRKIFDKRGDNRVGYWNVSTVVEIVHFYRKSASAATDTLEHRFSYRNYYPETLDFSRRATVTGPARHTPDAAFISFRLVARQLERNPTEVDEWPVLAHLEVDEGEGQVRTEVTLAPIKSHSARLPSEALIVSMADASDLDVDV